MTGNDVIQTTGIAPARVRLFQPTQRPTARNGEWITTAWGRCCVDGRLGQRHADLLEAMLFCAEKRHDEDAGTIKLLIDPARVRKVMSESRYSQKQLWVLIREIKKCVIEIDTSKMRLMGGIIDTAEYTKKETRRNPLTGEERRLWTIRLGKAWAELMRLDKTLNYDPTPIARLEHGISQAVARHILSHKGEPNGGWKLDTVIKATTGALNDQDMRNARYRLRADAVGLRKIGIQIEGDRVCRVSHPPDGVSHPPDDVSHPPDNFTPAQVPLGISGLLRPEMADSLAEHAIQANLPPAEQPPLPGLLTAACSAPAGALAIDWQLDGDQPSVAGTDSAADDEENRPHIVAGSFRGRARMKKSPLDGLIGHPAARRPQSVNNPAKGSSDAFAGHSRAGSTHG